jgi:hypothetical protein
MAAGHAGHRVPLGGDLRHYERRPAVDRSSPRYERSLCGIWLWGNGITLSFLACELIGNLSRIEGDATAEVIDHHPFGKRHAIPVPSTWPMRFLLTCFDVTSEILAGLHAPGAAVDVGPDLLGVGARAIVLAGHLLNSLRSE